MARHHSTLSALLAVYRNSGKVVVSGKKDNFEGEKEGDNFFVTLGLVQGNLSFLLHTSKTYHKI